MTDLTPEQMIEKMLQSLRRTGERFAKPRKKKPIRAARKSRTAAHRVPAKVQRGAAQTRRKGQG